MTIYFKNLFKDSKFRYLFAIILIGPISRWWSAIEANTTVLEAGRISFNYFFSSFILSFFLAIFLSITPIIFDSNKFKILKTVSFIIYLSLLAIGFGSFLSGIKFIYGNLKLLYGGTIILILISFYLKEKLSDFKLRKGVNFLFIFSFFSALIPIFLITTSYYIPPLLENGSTNYEKVEGNGNVLMLVFDEMSFSYFEKTQNEIPLFMPNLDKLASESNVYSKVATTYPFTDVAIPSMLSGLNSVENFAKSGERIDISEGPLKSLKNSHRIYSQLVVLDICKAVNCSESSYIHKSTFYVWLLDIFAIGGNVLPYPLQKYFPTLEGTWRNYWEIDDVCFNCYDYLPSEYPETELAPRDDVSNWFYLYHNEITHHPWNLDSKGKSIQPKSNKHFKEFLFPECIGLKRVLCTDDRIALSREVYSNGLMEADRIIGDFVTFLKSTNQYEQTMIIVTSDHGIILDGQGDGRRPKSLERVRPLAHVPLVVKFPSQNEGKIINDIKSTGQLISTIVKTVGVNSSDEELTDLNMDIPNDSQFVTENGEFIFSVKSIFENTTPPKKIRSNLKISAWNYSETNTQLIKEVIPSEGIVGHGYNSKRGASDVAIMAWFSDSIDCEGQLLLKYQPNGKLFQTIYDSSKKESLVWSIVEREENLKSEDFNLFCYEK